MSFLSSTSTSSSGMPAQYAPYIGYGMSEAKKLYDAPGPNYFPGSTVTPWSGQTQDALNMTEERARAGSPVMGAAQNQITGTLQGDNLFGGPAFNAALTAAENRIMPKVDSAFEKSGRYGSGLHKQAMAQALGDSFANQYGAERTNQMRAAMFAPQMAQADYQDFSQLANVGGAYEALDNANLQDEISRYNYEQNNPQAKLGDYISAIQGTAPYTGTTSTSSTPYYQNKTGNALGGAMTGFSIGSKLAGSDLLSGTSVAPYLGPLGAAGGFLSGLF